MQIFLMDVSYSKLKLLSRTLFYIIIWMHDLRCRHKVFIVVGVNKSGVTLHLGYIADDR